MRSTRDRNCPTDFALLPECAGNTRSHVLEQETVLDRVRGETRVRTCRNNRYRTSQSTRRDTRSHVSRQQISYFSEYAKRHEIARVRPPVSYCSEYAKRHEIARVRTQISYCSRSTRITRLHVSRINGVRQQDSAGNTTDDAEWMRNDAALFLMG